jgi:hypothetical protein
MRGSTLYQAGLLDPGQGRNAFQQLTVRSLELVILLFQVPSKEAEQEYVFFGIPD